MHNAQWGLRVGGFCQTTWTTHKQLSQLFLFSRKLRVAVCQWAHVCAKVVQWQGENKVRISGERRVRGEKGAASYQWTKYNAQFWLRCFFHLKSCIYRCYKSSLRRIFSADEWWFLSNDKERLGLISRKSRNWAKRVKQIKQLKDNKNK